MGKGKTAPIGLLYGALALAALSGCDESGATKAPTSAPSSVVKAFNQADLQSFAERFVMLLGETETAAYAKLAIEKGSAMPPVVDGRLFSAVLDPVSRDGVSVTAKIVFAEEVIYRRPYRSMSGYQVIPTQTIYTLQIERSTDEKWRGVTCEKQVIKALDPRDVSTNPVPVQANLFDATLQNIRVTKAS